MLKSYERQHRIEFLQRTWRENDTTNELESEVKTLNHAWASVIPQLAKGRFRGEYLFAMHKLTSSDARHAYSNALRWNRKVLTITSRYEGEDRYEVWAKEGEACQTMAS